MFPEELNQGFHPLSHFASVCMLPEERHESAWVAYYCFIVSCQ